MFSLKLLVLLTCVWGIEAMATIRIEGEHDSSEAKTIKSWVAQLNKLIQETRVRTKPSEGTMVRRARGLVTQFCEEILRGLEWHYVPQARPVMLAKCSYSSCTGKMNNVIPM